VTNFPRRKFLKTIGSAAVATALPNVILSAQTQAPSVALFWEPGFPSIQGCDLTLDTLQKALKDFAVTVLNERDLIAQLNTAHFDLLVTPFGSAFPKRAWPAMLQYLRNGGNWLNIGGVPLSRPVVRAGTEWRPEPTQTSYHKRLGITHAFPVSTSTYKSDLPMMESSFKAQEVFELYVRLSSSNNEPDEAGSDGPHEGVVQPLISMVNSDGRKVAAPVIEIDRLVGEFAGGRWVLANFNRIIEGWLVTTLAGRATLGALRFEVKSDFASYKPGETPTFTVEVLRPKGDLQKLASKDCNVEVSDSRGRVASRLTVPLKTDGQKASGSIKLPDGAKLAPGFYYVQATLESPPYDLTHDNGFWIYDDALLARGKALTTDQHWFYRDDKVFPVTGTTYMASDKHRRFLFEPNPFVWDKDFRAMKAAGVNMVRTGIWTGWKKYMPEVGKVDEARLRAFDAFLLTAHQYDIPVIFTFFAFLPETWGGANAYLDPRAVKAQQQFISAFTNRCRNVDDVIWDLINEPSFCSPKFLWNCRPNYDDYEEAAWKQWLKERYTTITGAEKTNPLQLGWRTTAADTLDLPKLQDFESVHLIDERQPLKTLDYRLFAQDMFKQWVRQMTTAIRSNGNKKQLITVGQDEAGVGDSPNMQFFTDEVDFTSLHNWWNNDDLVWDSVLAKTTTNLSLMEETGVMFYEKSDGGSWRSEEEVSRLLERKLAISFAVSGAGFIEWIWNTNPYMNSTNEVGIGFHRVDGSMKPELQPFLRIATFMARYGQLLQHRLPEPVGMVIPHSQMFAPRSFAQEATRRCVRAMYYHCGVGLQAISEYRVDDLSLPQLLIVPSPRVLTEKCWNSLLEQAQRGATIAISGPIDLNDHWLPSPRLSPKAESRPVAETEAITIGAREYLVRYEGEKMQRIEKTVVETPVRPLIYDYENGGKIIWSTLPLELGDSMSALVAFYRFALAKARIAPTFTASPQTPGVLVTPSFFQKYVLYTFVSEIDRDTRMLVTHHMSRTRFSVTVPAQRTAMVLLHRESGRIIGRL
jgi:cellulase (glycosyl hydrolase family 5)